MKNWPAYLAIATVSLCFAWLIVGKIKERIELADQIAAHRIALERCKRAVEQYE